MTNNENAKNDMYAFSYGDEGLRGIITYRKNLIEKIQNHNAENVVNEKIKSFPSNSVTGDAFEKFVSIAKEAGYTICKVEKL